MSNEDKRPRGRPSLATDERKNAILEGISKGTPLTVICRDLGISDTVVRNWMKDDEVFSCDIARARELGFDVIAHDALRIADTPLVGTEETTKEWGVEIKRADMIAHRRLQVDTRLKLLAKWDPKRYGDLMRQEISGPDGSPIAQTSVSMTAEQEAQLQNLIQLAQTTAKKL
jgi:hypothetical protein